MFLDTYKLGINQTIIWIRFVIIEITCNWQATLSQLYASVGVVMSVTLFPDFLKCFMDMKIFTYKMTDLLFLPIPQIVLHGHVTASKINKSRINN